MIVTRMYVILFVALSGCFLSMASAQIVDPETGKMRLYPFPPDAPGEASLDWEKLTPQYLRGLPDHDPLLYRSYHIRIAMEETTMAAGSPVPDMVEMDMWRRGDVAVQMVKKMFMEPPRESTQYLISIWLRYRPWMRPDEFVPLARQIYAAHREQPKTNYSSHLARMAMIDLLARWGEPQDERVLNEYLPTLNQEEPPQMKWREWFRERQALRSDGQPRGMPAWFFKEKHLFKTAIPDPVKTYEELKLSVSSPSAPQKKLPPPPPPPAPTKLGENAPSASTPTEAGPPWLIICGAFLALIILLSVQMRRTKN